MKNFTFLLAATLATLAAADVRTYSDAKCANGEVLVKTRAQKCYDLPTGRYGAGGCSIGHNLFIYSEADCQGDYVFVDPQACASLAGPRSIFSMM
ncbi:hypothetical protein LTR95_007239, partial [Oleoguttula sp. CCFEE 5521]